MGNWTTPNTIIFKNIRLAGDAKHFPAKPGTDGRTMPAVTFLFGYHGSKGGVDLPVDIKAIRGAALLANLKKGDLVIVEGQYEVVEGKDGKLRGRINDAEITTSVNLKERAGQTAAPAAPPAEPEQDSEGVGPAFD